MGEQSEQMVPVHDVRDVLESAFGVARRNLLLVLWHVVGGMIGSFLFAGVLVVILAAFLLPLVGIDPNSVGDWLAFLDTTGERLATFEFGLGIGGVVWAGALIWLTLTAVVDAGVYGGLAADIVGEEQRTPVWTWSARLFPRMLGYTVVRLLLELGVWLFGAVVVVWPAAHLFAVVAETGTVPMGTSALVALGLTATTLLGLLVYLWRMLALGPLLVDGQDLWPSLADAASHLGRHLGRSLKLLVGVAIVVSPVVLVYVAFVLMTSLLASQPQLLALSLMARTVLDVVFAVSMSAAYVFVAAVFLVQYALSEQRISTLPRAHKRPEKARRVPLRLGDPLPLPQIPGAGLVIMPIPQSHPYINSIAALFPHLSAKSTSDDEKLLSEGDTTSESSNENGAPSVLDAAKLVSASSESTGDPSAKGDGAADFQTVGIDLFSDADALSALVEEELPEALKERSGLWTLDIPEPSDDDEHVSTGPVPAALLQGIRTRRASSVDEPNPVTGDEELEGDTGLTAGDEEQESVAVAEHEERE